MQGSVRAAIVSGALGVLMLVLCVGSGSPLVMLFDLPDAAHFDGMRGERDRGGRWTGSSATIDAGAVAIGDVEMTLKVDRPGRPDPATLAIELGKEKLTVLVGEEPALARLTAKGPLAVSLSTGARRLFGARLLSLTAEPKGLGAMLPSPGLAGKMAAGSMLLTLALVTARFTPRLSAGASVLLWSLPLALFGWLNPYVTLRLVDTLWLIVPLFAFGLAGVRRGLGDLGVLLGVSSAVIRLMLLFHPSWYFTDLEIHLRTTQALREQGRIEGWVHMDELQQRFDLGRASVSGTMRPLPYPPFFHTLSSLGPRGEEVATMKALAVGAETATILLTFLIARKLFGSESAGAMAGLALSLLPFETLELLRMSFPAILGRAFDLAVILWLVSGASNQLASTAGRLKLGAGFAFCCLSYNASPVHFGIFIPLALLALALPPRRMSDARGLLAAAVFGGLVSLIFYGRYVFDLAFNVVAVSRVESGSVQWTGFIVTLARYHGPIFIAALIAAPLCVAEVWRRRESRLLLAWILWVPLMVLVALTFPGPFGYFRKQFFAHPLFAVLAARWAKTPSFLSRALAAIIVAWGLVQAAAYVPGLYITHSGRMAD